MWRCTNAWRGEYAIEEECAQAAENKNDEVDWHESPQPRRTSRGTAQARTWKTNSRSSRSSWQGAGHPYPQAFTEGATDEHYCCVERVDDLVLLRRAAQRRHISIDIGEFAMLNGGAGIAHLNMNNGDNRVENLKWVKEAEARKLLMVEDDEDSATNLPSFRWL